MKRFLLPTVAAAVIVGFYAACSDNQSVAPTTRAPSASPRFAQSVSSNGEGQCMFDDAVDAGYKQDKLQCVANDVDIGEADVNFYCIANVPYDPNNPACSPTIPLVAPNRISCTPGQHIYAKVDALIQNSAQERYDMGLWILDPGLSGDANTGAQCTQYNLIPGQNGSVNLDSDQCGDVNSTTTSISVPLDVLDLVCPGDGSTTVSIQACAGWSNSTTGSNDIVCPIDPAPPGTDGFRLGTTPAEGSKCTCNALPLPIDVKASLTLVKVVTNDNGGTKTLSDFPLTASGPVTISGVSGTTAVTGAVADAGTYALSEQTQTGYTASTWSCSGGTQSGSNITLASGGAATCTISNNDDAPHLTLVKVVTNDDGGTKTLSDFPLTASGPVTISGTSGTTAVTSRAVSAGSYALTEQTQTGYTASTWNCSGGTQSGANISLALGGSATCTISNNDNPPGLTLVKVVTNDNGGTKTLSDFPLTASGPVTISGVSGETAVTGRSVSAGSYALTEQTQAGYTASTWSCSGGTQSGANISLGLGGSATCTISNNDNGPHLTLVKVVTNDNGGTKTLSDFPLTASGPVTISGTSGTTAVNDRVVSAGSYALTEQTQAGYTASTWSCSGGTQSGANISLALGGSATCTISNNDNPPGLTLVKVVTNDNGGTKTLSDFPLTASGPVTISGVSGTTSVTARSVSAGTYALTEQTQTGYTASTWSCSGGTQSGANISLGLGGSATCTISNNDDAPHLTLVKVVTNDNGGTKTLSDFPLTASGPVTISGTSGTTAVTGRAVSAGSYALTEQTQTGYTASTWSCSGGTQSGANISLALGGSATCTISNNDDAPHLTLVKVVTNDNGGTKTLSDFPLTASGPVTISGTSGTTAVTARAVSAGSYALTEQTQTGYTASTWNCSGGTQSGANISLALGGSATCTISNNDNPASLTIIKYVIGDGSTFGFTATGTGITTPFNLSPATDGNAQVTYNNLSVGTYTVTEDAKDGYVLTDLGCGGFGNSEPYDPTLTRTVSITLALGESRTCTFTNEQQVSQTTRTQGFWATHESLVALYWDSMTLCGQALTVPEVLGGFWANISKTSTGGKRSSLDQARMQLLQQLLAAKLNHAAFGSSPTGSISIADAEAAFCSGSLSDVKAAQSAMAAFNTSGDNVVFTPGASANGKQAKGDADIDYWDTLP